MIKKLRGMIGAESGHYVTDVTARATLQLISSSYFFSPSKNHQNHHFLTSGRLNLRLGETLGGHSDTG